MRETSIEFFINSGELRNHKVDSGTRLFTASLFTHAQEKASGASAKHAGVGGGVSQVFRFALASSPLAILTASTIR